MSPAGDYDSIVLNLTNVSDGSVTQQTINKGDPLTLTYNGTDKVKVSAYALKDAKLWDAPTPSIKPYRGYRAVLMDLSRF